MWRTGLVAPRHVGSSRTRAPTRVPCIGRWILNYCTTREVPIMKNFKSCLSSQPKSPRIPQFGRCGALHGPFQESSGVSLSQHPGSPPPSGASFGGLAHLSPLCLSDLCLSLCSPPGSTHGVSDHDPFEDLTSPVMLPLPPPPPTSPSG